MIAMNFPVTRSQPDRKNCKKTYPQHHEHGHHTMIFQIIMREENISSDLKNTTRTRGEKDRQ
jgi:hypothetical protein